MNKIKTTVILLLAALPFMLMAQSPIDDLITKYENDKGITVVKVNAELFKMLSAIEISENDDDIDTEMLEEMEVLQQLEGIKLITADSANGKAPVNLFLEAKNGVTKDYVEMMSIKEEGENEVMFYVKYNQAKIGELLVLIGTSEGNNESVIISITGDIDLKNIGKIAKKMDFEGMDNLDKLKEKK